MSVVQTRNALNWLIRNPQYEYSLRNDTEINEYVNKNLKDKPEILNLYNNYKLNISRSDVYRTIILYLEGGIYADTDMEAIKDID